MKTEIIYISAIKREITFYIGKNQNENFEVIDKGAPNDLWFHANNISSCHVVCTIPEEITKKELRYIVKTGALLCKNNTNKLKSEKNVEIIYTSIKNIIKTDIPGSVITQNTKSFNLFNL
jgi:predicted ribosome quality control (RQC) complex YloA/Tae2 family protein